MNKFSVSTRNFLFCLSIIALSFLWTSCGYLSWLYNLLNLTTNKKADFLSEIIGYLIQALGILTFILVSSKIYPKIISETKRELFFAIFAVLDLFFIVLASTANTLATATCLGFVMNFLHGIIAAYYLQMLSDTITPNKQALTFGLGYGIASITSWIISSIGSTNPIKTNSAFIIYSILVLATLVILGIRKHKLSREILEEKNIPLTESLLADDQPISITKSTIVIACVTITLLTLVRGVGFYFPTADLSKGINLEFSRAFYAIGLVGAGIICDKKRSSGAVASLIALTFPFIMLSLSKEITTSVILWIIGYVFYGILNVYRIVVFSDIAGSNIKYHHIASFGLLFGRIGDAAGAYLGTMLKDKHAYLVILSSSIFAVVIILFFMLYNRLYMHITIKEVREEDTFYKFIQTYGFSAREQDVLKLILNGQTNGEISSNLFITESTVKFHIRNILRRTKCANRGELINLFKNHK